ncbi:hypothetical protein P7K49_040460, partial [Saguinus oedipus]
MKDPLLRCFRKSFTAISLYAGVLLERPVLRSLHRKHFQSSPSTHEFNSLNKGTAEQSFTAISKSFTAIWLYAEILLERPLNKGTAEQSFTGISLYAGILLERPLNKCKAEQSFTAIYLYVGIVLERAAEFYAISLYAGILLERPLKKGKAEQSEGYVSSVFKAEFYCYIVMCKNTAGKACFEIALQREFQVFPFNTRAESYCYFVIRGNTALKACLRSLHTKRFHTSPSTHEFKSAEFYCYFSICGKNDGKACFEISPQKAFPDLPFHKRIYL